MTSSERRRAARLVLWGAVLLAPLLACGMEGDLGRLGCPEGEICSDAGGVTFTRASVLRCGPTREPTFSGLTVTDDGTLEHDPWRARQPGSTAVALGGRTVASASSGLLGPPITEQGYSDHFELDPRGGARAVRLGAGRYSAYGGDVLLDYVSMPVLEAETALAMDDVSCPDQERVLLAGQPFSPRPLVLAPDGRALVDLDATARTLSGEASVIPGPRSDRVTFRLRYGEGGEALDTLRVVDAVDHVEVVRAPVDRLRTGSRVRLDGFDEICFRALSGDAVVLGIPIEAARLEPPVGLDIEVDGPCVLVTDTDLVHGIERPAQSVSLSVTLAGVTGQIELDLHAVLAHSDEE